MEFANRYEVWILHIWTSTGLMNRVSTSDLLSQLHKKDHFSERLLTEYEIWNLYENMNRIRTWSKENRLQLLWSLDFIRRKFFLICNRLTAYSAVQRKYKTSKWNGNLKDFCDRRFLIPLFNPLAEVRNERCWYTSFRRCYAFFMIQKYRFEISIDVKTELTIAKAFPQLAISSRGFMKSGIWSGFNKVNFTVLLSKVPSYLHRIYIHRWSIIPFSSDSSEGVIT